MLPEIQSATRELIDTLTPLTFSEPVSHVYNPLDYAWESHSIYLERFASQPKRVLFLGMNPGPWGMAQTGVPFGEIASVRDWMKIEATVQRPSLEHPKRPIEGFDCQRSEVSGKRLWGLFAERYPNASDFFAEHFVANFCPLVWMADSGRNLTPDKLSKAELAPVEEACRDYLATLIRHLQPHYLIGVGAFAEKQLIKTVREKLKLEDYTIGKILHPSPASPAANRGWAEAATKQLIEQNIWSI